MIASFCRQKMTIAKVLANVVYIIILVQFVTVALEHCKEEVSQETNY